MGLYSHGCPQQKRWSCNLLSRRTPRLARFSRLQPGTPTAPASDDVPLLSSDPGGVGRLAPRRTQPSSPLEARSPETCAPLEKAFDLARADCESDIRRCFRAPLAPHLARPAIVYARLGELSKKRRGRDLNPRGSSPTRSPIVRTRPGYATSPN